MLYGEIELGGEHKLGRVKVRESISFDSIGKQRGNFGFSYNF